MRSKSQFAKGNSSLELDVKRVKYQSRQHTRALRNSPPLRKIETKPESHRQVMVEIARKSPKIQMLERMVTKERDRKKGLQSSKESLKLPDIKQKQKPAEEKEVITKESEVLRKSRDETGDFGIEEYVKETEEISEEDGPILEAVAPRKKPQPSKARDKLSLTQNSSKKLLKPGPVLSSVTTSLVRKSSDISKELKQLDKDLWQGQGLDDVLQDPLTALASLKTQIVNDYISQLDVNAWEGETDNSTLSPLLIKNASMAANELFREPTIPQKRATSIARVQPKYNLDQRNPHRGVIVGLRSIEHQRNPKNASDEVKATSVSQLKEGRNLNLLSQRREKPPAKIKNEILMTAGGLISSSPKNVGKVFLKDQKKV